MSCLFDLGACVQNTFWNTIGLIPWWGWIVGFAVLLGVAWRLGGIPGLVAAAAGIGFLFGRFRPPAATKADPHPWARPEPGVTPMQNVDHKPKGGIKPVSDEWKKRMGM